MDEATLAINAHHDSINEQDVEKYLKTVKFPFTYQNHTGVSITIESADEYILRLIQTLPHKENYTVISSDNEIKYKSKKNNEFA